ncbi:hypothetical protein TKK_0005715 [Trichogramma kaykai]
MSVTTLGSNIFLLVALLGSASAAFFCDTAVLGFQSHLPRDTSNLGNGPVRYYQRAHGNGRTEVMEALIEPKHLNKGSAPTKGARDYAHRMGKANDDAGHILAARLGGSGSDLRNIFPQSKNINRGVWAQAEADVANAVQKYKKIHYVVNLIYKDQKATRPYQINYKVTKPDGGVLFCNDVVNPN